MKKIPRTDLKEITVIRNGKFAADCSLPEVGPRWLVALWKPAARELPPVSVLAWGIPAGDYLDRRKTVLTLIE